MTDQEIRMIIVEALDYASVFAMQDNNLQAAFLDGQQDIPLEELGMDSLAVMELCIAIEINAGVSIVSSELQSIDTLNRLVDTVRERLR